MRQLQNTTKQVAILALLVVISWFVTNYFVLQMIASMYQGTSWEFLNHLMTNRQTNSIEHYINKVSPMVMAGHILIFVVCCVVLTLKMQSAILTLGLLFSGDAAAIYFSSLDVIWVLDLRADWSLPEIFQYFKEAFLALIFVSLWRQRKERLYVIFCVLSIFFLLDDSLKYHESVGHLLAPAIDRSPLPDLMQVPSNFIGEIISLVPLLLLVPFGAFYFFKADIRMKYFSAAFVFLIGVLFAFGVVIDILVHADFVIRSGLQHSLAAVEDSGEMITISVLLSYVLSEKWRLVRNSEMSSNQLVRPGRK